MADNVKPVTDMTLDAWDLIAKANAPPIKLGQMDWTRIVKTLVTEVRRLNANTEKLLGALGNFVNEYDNDRNTWPDDMVDILDTAHEAIAETTGELRKDYTGSGFSIEIPLEIPSNRIAHIPLNIVNMEMSALLKEVVSVRSTTPDRLKAELVRSEHDMKIVLTPLVSEVGIATYEIIGEHGCILD